MTVASVLTVLLACGVAREERAASDIVTWRGYVFRSPVVEDGEDVLSDGTITVSPLGGDAIPAEQPFPDEYPGYWSVELPAGAAVRIDIEGEGLYPSRWAADAPSNDGSWSTGSVFGMERAWADATFAGVGELATVEVPPLDATRTHAWAFRRDGAGGVCEDLTIGGVAPVCLLADEAGELSVVTEGVWSQAFVFGLAPGPVELAVGGRVLETYVATGGDVVVAGWIAGDDG